MATAGVKWLPIEEFIRTFYRSPTSEVSRRMQARSKEDTRIHKKRPTATQFCARRLSENVQWYNLDNIERIKQNWIEPALIWFVKYFNELLRTLRTGDRNYERVRAASEAKYFLYNGKNISMSVPARPDPAWNAFERLTSQQPLDRFARGLFHRITSSLPPTIGLFRHMWVTPSARVT